MKFNQFFVAMAALAALICTSCSQQHKSNMQYRALGNTGIEVSEIGIGCGVFEYLDSAQSIAYMDLALDSGVNYMDIYDANPAVLNNIGIALRGRRDKMNLQGHIGNWWNPTLNQNERTRNVEQARIGFDDMLSRLGTDHIEVGLIFMSDDLADWDSLIHSPFMDYAESLVKEGKVKHLGMSSHNPEVALAAAKSGKVEVIMFSLNPAFDLVQSGYSAWDPEAYNNLLPGINPVRTELYNYCVQHQIGIVVMKVFGGGGRLLDAAQSPLGFALTVNQCIAYALSNPAVSCALVGSRKIEHLMEDLQYLSATDTDKDFSQVMNQIGKKEKHSGQCTYCGHCTPCPVGIDIAKVNELLDKAGDNPSAAVQQEYDALDHHASECTACGACEKRCPFDVPVREKMAQAVKVFGK